MFWVWLTMYLRRAVMRTLVTDLTSDDILQEDILGVCGGRHLQLEPPAIVVAAQGPEVGLLQISRNNVIFRRSMLCDHLSTTHMDSLNPLELHHLLVRIWQTETRRGYNASGNPRL